MSDDIYAEYTVNGIKVYVLNGVYHRNGAPAVLHPNGQQEWWQHGQLHRESGPAVIYADGVQEYWYRDKLIPVKTFKEFQSYIRMKAFW